MKIPYINDIRKYESLKFPDWFDIEKHLINRFPDCFVFAVPTTLKGIGKSYSSVNYAIKKINAGGMMLFINWTEQEIDATVDEWVRKPWLFEEKLDFEIEWTKMKRITICRKAENQEVVAYFVTPRQFKVLKGLASLEEKDLKSGVIFWDEFLLPEGIYMKGVEQIHALFQVIGSLFRAEDWILIMCANNVNPANPFNETLFKNIGWPDTGETFVDHTARAVIDSPHYNDFMKAKYENTPLFHVTKLIPKLHTQMFGDGRINDSVFVNQELIIYRLDEEVEYETSIQIGVSVIHIFVFKDSETGEELFYSTDIDLEFPPEYAGNIETQYQTKLPKVPESLLESIVDFAFEKKFRYNSVKTMNDITKIIIGCKKKVYREIDWSKRETN